MVKRVSQLRCDGTLREAGPGQGRVECIEIDAIAAKCRGVLGIGPYHVAVDAQVVVYPGESLDHAAVLLGCLCLVPLALDGRQ